MKPKAYHYWGARQKASGYEWNAAFRRIAQKLHQEWVTDIMLAEAGMVRKTAPPIDAPPSLHEAIKEFYDVKACRFPRNSQEKLGQALKAHLPSNLPMDYDVILNQIATSLRESSYSTTTLQKHLLELRRMFRYFVERRWLDRNPVDLIGIPRSDSDRERHVWTRDEVNAIVADMRKHGPPTTAPWSANFVEWMSLTAMRPGEILAMRWNHIKDDEVDIPRTKTRRPRSIPLVPLTDLRKWPVRRTWQARLAELLDELRGLYEGRDDVLAMPGRNRPAFPEGSVYPWNNSTNVRRAFSEAVERLGLPSHGRLYDLRASAEDYWVWELGFDLKRICALAGHSIATYSKHYQKRYGAEDRRRMITD